MVATANIWVFYRIYIRRGLLTSQTAHVIMPLWLHLLVRCHRLNA